MRCREGARLDVHSRYTISRQLVHRPHLGPASPRDLPVPILRLLAGFAFGFGGAIVLCSPHFAQATTKSSAAPAVPREPGKYSIVVLQAEHVKAVQFSLIREEMTRGGAEVDMAPRVKGEGLAWPCLLVMLRTVSSPSRDAQPAALEQPIAVASLATTVTSHKPPRDTRKSCVHICL